MEIAINSIDRYEAFSFVLFLSVSVFSILLLQPLFWLFFVLLVIDGILTIFHDEVLISIDRLVFGATLITASIIEFNLNALLLIIETLLLFVILDFSFLMIRVGNTKVEPGLFKHRLLSYCYIVPISFAITLGSIYFYSVFPLGPEISVPVLGFASIGVFMISLLAIKAVKST